MPRYKLVDRSPCLLPVVLLGQTRGGNLELAAIPGHWYADWRASP